MSAFDVVVIALAGGTLRTAIHERLGREDLKVVAPSAGTSQSLAA